MIVKWTVGIACAAIVAMTLYRGVARAAEQHPAMTADAPPGWQLQRALPGEQFRPRGRYFSTRTGCQLDLASDAIVQPTGTRLMCLRIERKDER